MTCILTINLVIRMKMRNEHPRTKFKDSTVTHQKERESVNNIRILQLYIRIRACWAKLKKENLYI